MSKSAHIMLNGKFCQSDAHFIGANSGLFESGIFLKLNMRANSGKIYFIDNFYSLLIDTLEFFNIKPSIDITKEIIAGDIYALLQKNRLYQGADVRLVVFFDENNQNILLSCQSSSSKYQINNKGLEAVVETSLKLPVQSMASYPVPAFNPVNQLPKQKLENTTQIPLLTNKLGNILQSPTANVFMLNGNTIFTPSLDQGCTFDVLRDVTIQLAKDLNFKVIDDAEIQAEYLIEMDEVFALDSLNGFTWVSAYKNRRYYNKTVTQFMNKLNDLAFKSIGL